MCLGEQKANANFGNATSYLLRFETDVDPSGLEYISAAALARHLSVAMFGDLGTGCGCDECGC